MTRSEPTALSQEYDLVVIGGGPGGYTAAIRARQLGLRCALIEKEELGGVCLNWGCIPTKALLHAAEAKHLVESLASLGLVAGEVTVDIAKLVKRSRQVAGRLVKGVGSLMRKHGVDVIRGTARLGGGGSVVVASDGDTVTLKAANIILASGARARQLPGLAPDGHSILTYREAMMPDTLPASLLVVGAGAIGIEFASFYADLGTEVTVVEMADRILPQEDAEISQLAREAFEKRGIRIHTAAKVGQVGLDGATRTAVIDLGDGQESPISVERILVAVGITGNVEDLGLEKTAVAVERGHVIVDELLATAEPGIYAIGDLVGPPWLAHKASHEAVICVEHIAGGEAPRPLDVTKVPACTYSRPQVASVGLTEDAARNSGLTIRVGRFPFQANGKALAIDERRGLVKTVIDDATGEILGAHMLGAGVTELIHGVAVARSLEAIDLDWIETVFPHPTLSEMMHESVLDAAGRALNI